MPYAPGAFTALRSILFTPGHLAALFPKAAAAPADGFALDLEDAVPPAQKAAARPIIRDALQSGIFAGRRVLARVNAFESGLTAGDVAGVACRELAGFIYPMTHAPAEIQALDALLAEQEAAQGLPAGHFAILPLIETAAGVLQAAAIATASPRVAALIFGGEDYLAEMGGRHDPAGLCFHTPRVQIILAARAAGIEPLDTPYVDVAQPANLSFSEGKVLQTSSSKNISAGEYTPIELVNKYLSTPFLLAASIICVLNKIVGTKKLAGCSFVIFGDPFIPAR